MCGGCGGKGRQGSDWRAKASRQCYFYPVTLVRDVDHGCALVDEEQFGPALPIIRYVDLKEAIAKANSSEFGLEGLKEFTTIQAVFV